MPRFVIDLDENPYTRWQEPTKAFLEQIIKLQETVISFVPQSLLTVFWLVSMYMETTTFYLNSYGELSNELFLELKGISDITGIPVHQVLAANFVYELFAHCTSIVSLDKHGDIIHARNLDYPIYDSMRDDTYDADFIKDGKFAFKATMFGGGPNPYTIMKPGAFAISINARHENDLFGLANSLSRWFSKSHNPGSLLIYIGEHANTFEEAKEMMMNIQITSPCYFTLSGIEPDEAVVITRGRTGSIDLWPINPESQSDWAIYQTNYDHWEDEPDRDNKRAAHVKAALKKIGREHMSMKKLVKSILQIPPVLQVSTIFTTAMSAKKNYYKTHRYI